MIGAFVLILVTVVFTGCIVFPLLALAYILEKLGFPRLRETLRKALAD